MKAQDLVNQNYQNLCAQYAHLGFEIDRIVVERRKVRQNIQTLQNAMPVINQAEAAIADQEEANATGKPVVREIPPPVAAEKKH